MTGDPSSVDNCAGHFFIDCLNTESNIHSTRTLVRKSLVTTTEHDTTNEAKDLVRISEETVVIIFMHYYNS